MMERLTNTGRSNDGTSSRHLKTFIIFFLHVIYYQATKVILT